MNGIPLINVSHDQAVKALQSDLEGVHLKVARVVNPNGTNEVCILSYALLLVVMFSSEFFLIF